MHKYPRHLIALIAHLKKLPGVGGRTAERFAFDLMEWSQQDLEQFAQHVSYLKNKVQKCPESGCLTEEDGYCALNDSRKRDTRFLCIISSAKDAYAVEQTGVYKGLYHVTGGLLSPLDGKAPKDLHLEKLQERIQAHGIQEVIIALDSTVEGDTTALFLKEQLALWGIKSSRLAFGIPIGSALEFVDSGTLTRALTGRLSF